MTLPLTQPDAVAPAVFRREVRRWSKRIGVDVREIRLRSMKRKLASASSAGRLTFDTTLLAEPQTRRDEVVVHELVHLRVGNHGPLFRNLVRAHLAEASVSSTRRQDRHASLRLTSSSERSAPPQTSGLGDGFDRLGG
jgi:predicted metal-dependent hydrolase